MAKTASMSVRLDPEIKKQAEDLYSTLGISLTDAFNIFVHQSLLIGGLPFLPKIPQYNKETLEAIEQVENNENLSQPFDSIEDLMRDLNA